MKKQNLNKAPEKLYFKHHGLFSIPLSDFADEMNKERDKNWYVKVKELERKTQKLKEKMELLSKQNSDRVQLIQEMIAESYNISDRRLQRR